MTHLNTQENIKIPKRAFTRPSIVAVVFFVLIVFLLVPNTLSLFANKASFQDFVLVYLSPLLIPGLFCSYHSGLALAKIIYSRTGSNYLVQLFAMFILQVVCIVVCIGIEMVLTGYPFQMCFDICQGVEIYTAVISYFIFSTILFLPAYYALYRYRTWICNDEELKKTTPVGRELRLKNSLAIVLAVAICSIGFGICELIDLNNKINIINKQNEQISSVRDGGTSNVENNKNNDNDEDKLNIEITPYDHRKSRINVLNCLGGCGESYEYSNNVKWGFSIHNLQNGNAEVEIDSDKQGMLYGKHRIDFDSEIINVYRGFYGDATSLLFLKQDGTVDCVMPYPNPYLGDAKSGEGKLEKYSLDGVEDVIYFMQAVRVEDGNNLLTILAFRSDGNFYDLSNALKNVWSERTLK